MAIVYPAALDSFSTKVDNVDTVSATHVNDLQAAIVALENQVGAGATVPNATAATANTLAKRNTAGGIVANTIYLPRSNEATLFSIDATLAGLGGAITILNAGTAYPFTNANVFGGLFIVHEASVNDGMGMFMTCAGLGVLMVTSIGGNFGTTIGTATKTNVYAVGTNVVIQNLRGATRVYSVFSIRTNPTN